MVDDISPDTCPTSNSMPMLGIGTWQNTDPAQCAESVQTALEMGYRHVDTAQAYGNEAAVGEGIANADVDREELFVATKIDTDNLAGDDVVETAHESADRLGVEYIDLLYVHWPLGMYDPEDTLTAFEILSEDGLIEHIGVSNFEPETLEVATDVCSEPIFANQVELHPLLPQDELREVCSDEDIEVVAYSPLARGEVFDVPEIQDVAEKHDASEAQVALAWAREKGVTPIPKATGRAHIADNWGSLALELETADLETIDSIDRRQREIDPAGAPWN